MARPIGEQEHGFGTKSSEIRVALIILTFGTEGLYLYYSIFKILLVLRFALI